MTSSITTIDKPWLIGWHENLLPKILKICAYALRTGSQYFELQPERKIDCMGFARRRVDLRKEPIIEKVWQAEIAQN